MSLIQVKDLTFAYEGSYENVFEKVSFSLDTDWRLGLIGRNGKGKTTFLNLLLGKYEYRGSISASVKFEYFPCQVSDAKKLTAEVMEEVGGGFELWQLYREMDRLEVSDDVLYRPFETLSDGERTKMLLAALFLGEKNFVLIDEPTNHLDEEARQLVGKYLQGKKGFILVSHDRELLDQCTDHILSINRNTIEVQRGNFSSWKENKDRKDQFETASNERLKGEIKRLSQAASRTAGWSDQIERGKIGNHAADRGYIGHKAEKMMKRAKSIEKRSKEALEEKKGLLKDLEEPEDLKMFPLLYHSERMIEYRDVSLSYGEKTLFSHFNLTVHRGERIALTGKNGCGKSSLLKALPGVEEVPGLRIGGSIQCPGGLIISYVSQRTAGLSGNLSEWAYKKGIDETIFKTLLRKLDFSRSQFEKPMEAYSEGQKKKVLLAASICQKAHVYIWDEPLNFIDIFSRMQIEELILKCSPTLIFVEHDRRFRDQIATRIVEVG